MRVPGLGINLPGSCAEEHTCELDAQPGAEMRALRGMGCLGRAAHREDADAARPTRREHPLRNIYNRGRVSSLERSEKFSLGVGTNKVRIAHSTAVVLGIQLNFYGV